MTAKAKHYHICTTCHEQVPLDFWDDHVQTHKDQLDMFPEIPKTHVQRRRKSPRDLA